MNVISKVRKLLKLISHFRVFICCRKTLFLCYPLPPPYPTAVAMANQESSVRATLVLSSTMLSQAAQPYQSLMGS